MYALRSGKKRDVLLARTLSGTFRKWHHVLFQLTNFLIADQPTLGTKRFGVREDFGVMMVHVGSGGD